MKCKDTTDSSAEIPEDLGIKIGSKEEAAWTKIRDDVQLMIEQGDRERMLNVGILALAEQMIEAEKLK